MNPNPKENQTSWMGQKVCLLQLYRIVGDHEQLFSVPLPISFGNWSCCKIHYVGHVWCQLELKVMYFISVSYPQLRMLFCLFISFSWVSLVFIGVRKGTWFSFLAINKMRGGKRRLEEGKEEIDEAQTFKTELFFPQNNYIINPEIVICSYPRIHRYLLLRDLRYCRSFWNANWSLNECEVSFLLFKNQI